MTAPLTFKNNDPAWFANLGPGDPAAKVRLIVPTGTTVTGVPVDCDRHTLTDGYSGQRTGAPRYDCALRLRPGHHEQHGGARRQLTVAR
ncbi:hypothetical protein [Streptomyces sp. NBC_01483]|uniref:hypothetical protein n=1 Tax=Streptomyces sp. NBC_01483 TaxID=2903883 RepID=UPI002E3053B4|nr:hypothetical protein [Streptomyces sp. NBC_01483]